MRTHTDPWAIQNDWKARQHHDEMEDCIPRRCGHCYKSPWRDYAAVAMVDYVEARIGLAEAMGRVVNAARQLSRQQPTEAELLEDAEHALEGE